jgi:hypothetical protein
VNSSTLLLPEWRRITKELKLHDKLIPRDVSTRWNSTFDMLDTALEYRKAIDVITSERVNGLRQFELTAEEWKLAGQLHNILKVCTNVCYIISSQVSILTLGLVGSQACNNLLFTLHPQPCSSNPFHGLYRQALHNDQHESDV